MITFLKILAVVFALMAVCVFVCWRVGRVLRRSLHRDRTADVGPDSLRLLQELDAHLDDYVAADPELAAGFDRLRDALREHRQQEDGT